MPGDEVIDLTVTDDENDAGPAKRSRRAAPADSDVVIIDSETAAEPSPSSQADEEIQIVSARVENWSTMAHQREHCRRHPFSAAMARGNASFCDHCFCYVCDVPAKDCKQWGNGASMSHHCNAHSKNAGHRQARATATAARQAAAGGASGSGGGAGSGAAPQRQAPALVSQQRPGQPSQANNRTERMSQQVQHMRSKSQAALVARERREAERKRRVEAAAAERARQEAAAVSERARQIEERLKLVGEMRAMEALVASIPSPPSFSGEEYDSEEGYNSEEDGMFGYLFGMRTSNPFGDVRMYRGGGVNPPTHRPAVPAPAPPQKCNMKAKPDPAATPDMFLLATLAFECEATAAGGTIADVAARMVPTGFYTPGRNDPRACYGNPTRTGLLHLVEDLYTGSGHQNAPLKLAPHRPPPPPDAPGPTRVRKLVLRYADGRSLPTLHGITVPAESTVAGVLEAARAQLGADALPPGARLVPHRLEIVSTVGMDLEIKDEAVMNGSWTLAAFVLPPSADDAAAPSKGSKKRRRSEAAASTIGAEVLVDIGKVEYRMGIVSEAASSIRSPVLETGYRNSVRPRLLLPMPDGATISGGPATHTAIARAAVAALEPFRTTPDDAEETERLVRDVKVLYGPRNSYCSVAESIKVSEGLNEALAQRYVATSAFPNARPLQVTVAWDDIVLAAAFNAAAWDAAPAAPSAAPAALAPTEDYLTALRRHRRAADQAKELPRRVAREIDGASSEEKPAPVGAPVLPPTSVSAAAARYMNNPPAICRYKLALEPASKRAGEKKGILRVSVYAWRTAGLGHEAFFAAGHAFSGADNARRGRRHHHSRSVHAHRLALTLRTYFEDVPAFKTIEERRQHWVAQDESLSHRRSITALLEAMERPEAPAAPQPPGLSVTLRPYQRQSLQFMLEAERGEGGFRRHLWAPVTAADGTTEFYYSPVLGRAAQGVPAQPWGGFCCEEMGLGKTVEMLALCLANPAPVVPTGSKDGAGRFISRATLVVCAVSLVGQWVAEAQEKTRGALRIYQYHGSGRLRDARRLAEDYDIVVTTYATLSADCGNKKSRGGFNTSGTPLHSVKWHRLVLDESHTCKNPVVGHTKACVALEADRRWLCSGTPINTDVGDLYGQFATLRLSPFDVKPFFDANVRHAFGNNVFSGGCPELLHTLGAVMVRHTKRQELGGEAVLQLPPKSERLVPVALTATEQATYNAVHARSADIFQRYAALGPRFVSRSLLAIMALLLPMRRICSGGALVPRDLEVAEPDLSAAEAAATAADAAADAADAAGVGPGAYMGGGGLGAVPTEVDESLVAPADEECPICMDSYECPAVTSCNHWFCKDCIVGALAASSARCPLCRTRLRANQLRLGITAGDAAARAAEAAEAGPSSPPVGGSQPEPAEAATAAVEAAVAATIGGLIAESKLDALLRELRAMRRADPTAKALVFSQYNSTIEWLKGRLPREGFGHRHISGSMPLKQRAAAINAFQGDPPTTVFLLSMRSGAVGINLTAATHVFLMEPALNPALEEQAIGRAWRMGQRRPVTVLRFYVQGSVEERIMEVAKARQGGVAGGAAAAAAAAAGPTPLNILQGMDMDDDVGAGAYMGRGRGGRGGGRGGVRVEDQAGSIKEDRQNLRLGELQALFRTPEFPPPRVEATEEEEEEEEAAGGSGSGGSGGGGTGVVHPRPGSAGGGARPSGAAPAAVQRSRMRRSKAGMAAVAAGTPMTVGGGAGGSGSGAGPSGVTPAATLPGAPRSGTGPGPQTAGASLQQRQVKPVAAEPEEEAPPADILARIRSLANANANRATGRLTPAEASGASAGAVAATAAAKRGPSRAALEAAAGGNAGASAALASHIPRPTPDTVAGGGGGAGGGRDSSRRSHRRVPRLNYAALVDGEADAAAAAGAERVDGSGSGSGEEEEEWSAGDEEVEMEDVEDDEGDEDEMDD